MLLGHIHLSSWPSSALSNLAVVVVTLVVGIAFVALVVVVCWLPCSSVDISVPFSA